MNRPINPHRRAFRAHRLTSLAGMEVDEYLQTDWVTYAEAASAIHDDRNEVMGNPNHYKSLRISWRIEEQGVSQDANDWVKLVRR